MFQTLTSAVVQKLCYFSTNLACNWKLDHAICQSNEPDRNIRQCNDVAKSERNED